MKNYIQLLVALLLIAIAVVSRTLLHLPNFAALAAVGLFAGFYFRNKVAFIIPIVAVLISDFFIGFYDLGTMSFVYLAWMLPVAIGWMNISFGRLNKVFTNILTVGAKSLLASFSFYLVSNLGVWMFSGMYVLNFTGLIECYTLAIPFLRATFLGDVLFSGVIFGSYYLMVSISPNRKNLEPVYIKK